MFIGNWEHVESETHKQRLGDKVAGHGYMGLDESVDITTVNEQGVQWDFTDVEMRTCSLFVACTSCSTMKDGTSYMNTAKASCHGGKIASKKFRR